MKETIIKIAMAVLILISAAGMGYFAGKSSVQQIPAQTITKTEIQYVDRVVEKGVYIKDATKTDTTITKPDGTIEHTVVQNDINTSSQDKETVKVTTQIVEKTEIKPEPTKGFIWLPLNLNAGLGLTEKREVLAMGDVTLLGWGVSKNDLSFKFASVGVDYNKVQGCGFHITAISYRLIPKVFTNTYMGLGYGISPKERSAQLSIEFGL